MMSLGREFVEAINAIAETRGLDIDVVVSTMAAALQSAYNKYQQREQETEIDINHKTGDIRIYELLKVIPDLADESPVERDKKVYKEIKLSEAQKYNPAIEVGEILKIEQNPTNFGRIAAQTARQVIAQRLRDEERKRVYNEFADRVGDMILGRIYKTEGDDIIVRLTEKAEAELPRRERLSEKYEAGQEMKFYVLEVKQKSRGPKIKLSRSHPGLLRKLMEMEIPEIREGIIEIHNIAREGGGRAKVSLSSVDGQVDAVGACIGNGGLRIRAVSSELNDEKIDVLEYSADPLIYIKNALAPAQIAKVEPVLDKEREANVYVYPDQLSLAIGKGGQNVKLAAKLTGWKINVATVEPERMPTLKDIFHDVFDEKK